MSSQDLPKPDFARNMKLIGHTDQGGRPDGVQIMVNKGHAFVGHMFSKGFSVIDVRDPRKPKPVNYVPAPHNTWTIHLQTHGDLLLVINARDMFAARGVPGRAQVLHRLAQRSGRRGRGGRRPRARDWTAGLAVYDISNPAEPRQIGFMPVEGGGIHRIWYTGGRWAYVSAMLDGFTDYIFMTVDMADPTQAEGGRPLLAARHEHGGRRDAELGARTAATACTTPSSTATPPTAPGATAGWSMIDVSDRSKPEAHHAPQLVAALRRRHAQLPAAARPRPAGRRSTRRCSTIARTASSTSGCSTSASRPIPISISTFPTPDEADYCKKGAHFGPHNIHENRPDTFVSSDSIFATYQNAGIRVFDIRDPFRPKEVGAFVPPAPERLVDGATRTAPRSSSPATFW